MNAAEADSGICGGTGGARSNTGSLAELIGIEDPSGSAGAAGIHRRTHGATSWAFGAQVV